MVVGLPPITVVNAINQKMLQSLQEKSYIQKDDAGQWRVFITPSV